ncbi:MAG: SUMF1/EgtB/PvdO family nonheme iron enzyme [Planctomycetota bacterium]
MAELRLTHDGAAPRNDLFRLTGDDILGRSFQSQIPLPDPFVSSSHARVTATRDGYYLEDLKSVNGTFLNGRMVRRARLSSGDTIKIRNFTLVFIDEERTQVGPSDSSSSSLRLQTATLIATCAPEDLAGAPAVGGPSAPPQRHLQVLYNVSRAAAGSFTVQSLSEAILIELFRSFSQADGAFILTPDAERLDFSVVASRKGAAASDLVPSSTILRHVCETREAVLSACALDDPRFQNAQSVVNSATTSVLCAPAVVEGDLLALIYVATRRPGRAFDKDDLHLIVCLAAVFAVAMRNAKRQEPSQRPLDAASLVAAVLSKPALQSPPSAAPPPPAQAPPAPSPVVAEPALRAPAGFRAKEGTKPEPYTNTGLPLEVIHEKTGIEMVFIPAGEFQMGSPVSTKQRFSDECPAHTVRITSSFYLGKYQVTQQEWKRLMGTDPSRFKGDRNPVERVSWDDCRSFLSKAGDALRLPTEAEWEYACRAGTRTAYSFGDHPAQLGSCAWYDSNSGGTPHPVGEKSPNPWGLSDMHGNVWEWCADWCGEDYYSWSPRDDPHGPASGEYRVLRGGSWSGEPATCRSANRRGYVPALSSSIVGFRIARGL